MPNLTKKDLKEIRDSYDKNKQEKSFHDIASQLYPDSSSFVAFQRYFKNKINQCINDYQKSQNSIDLRNFKAQAIADLFCGYQEAMKGDNYSEKELCVFLMNKVINSLEITKEQLGSLSKVINSDIDDYNTIMSIDDNGQMDISNEEIIEEEVVESEPIESNIKIDYSLIKEAYYDIPIKRDEYNSLSKIENGYNEVINSQNNLIEENRNNYNKNTIRVDQCKKNINEFTKTAAKNEIAKYMAAKELSSNRNPFLKILLFPRTIYEAIKVNNMKKELQDKYKLTDKDFNYMDSAIKDRKKADELKNIGTVEYNTKDGFLKYEENKEIQKENNSLDNDNSNKKSIDQKDFQNKLGEKTNQMNNSEATKQNNLDQYKTLNKGNKELE